MSEVHPVFTRLTEDHRRFTAVLVVLEQVVSAPEADWPLARMCLRYLSEYADEIHHKVEDVVFKNLLNAQINAEQREAVIVNARQHKTLADASARLIRDVDLVLQDTVVPASRILNHLGQYVKAQRDHIRYENEYVFPLARAHIQTNQWEQVSAELQAAKDPLFDAREAEFGRLFEEVSSLAEELSAEGLSAEELSAQELSTEKVR